MADWANFYVMVGGASAALTGLVLVAVSLRTDAILRHPLLRDRSFSSLMGLVTALLISTGALVPQPASALGVELLLVTGFWLVRYAQFIQLYRGVGTRHRRALRGPEWVLWAAWIASFATSGLLLIAGQPAGPYVLAASIAAGMLIIIWNVWVLMADVPTA